MKKYGLMLLVGSILGVGCSWADSVYSNTVGFQRTDVFEGYNMISCPFGDDGVDIQDFIKNLDDLTGSGDKDLADSISFFNGSGYEIFALFTNATERFWMNYNSAAWQYPEFVTPEAAIYNIEKGTGCWLKITESSETIVTSGAAQSATNAPIGTANSFNLVSFPYSAGTSIADLPTEGLLGGTNKTEVTRLSVWNGTGYATYGFYDDDTGSSSNPNEFWMDYNSASWQFPEFVTPTATTNKIAMGSALWLIRPDADPAIDPDHEVTFTPPSNYGN